MVNLGSIYEFNFLSFDFGLVLADTVQQGPVLVSDRACFFRYMGKTGKIWFPKKCRFKIMPVNFIGLVP